MLPFGLLLPEWTELPRVLYILGRREVRLRLRAVMRWVREPGARVSGGNELDADKVQAPGAIAAPGGGWRLFCAPTPAHTPDP